MSAKVPHDDMAWQRIEALARSAAAPGPSTELGHAVEIAARNGGAWMDLLYASSPQITDYPGGADAVDALGRWMRQRGGLAPASPRGDTTTHLLCEVARVAIDTATRDVPASLDVATYLGHRLVVEGRSFVEANFGVRTLRDAMDRALALGRSIRPDDIPVSGELLRVVAAEAVHARRSMTYIATPEGQREIEAQLASLDPDKRKLVEAHGGALVDQVPSPGEIVATIKFWLAALDDARMGEPTSTTLDRVRRATTGELWTGLHRPLFRSRPDVLERFANELEEIRRSRTRT